MTIFQLHRYIYIQPPGDGHCSDENSADEDACEQINNLPGSQLREEAESIVRMNTGEIITINTECHDKVPGPQQIEKVSNLCRIR